MAQGNIVDAGDVLIVGAGLAGLFTALKAARPFSMASSWADSPSITRMEGQARTAATSAFMIALPA